MTSHALSAAALAALAFAITPVTPAGAACFLEWSDAALVVESERLTPVRSVHDLARRHVPGELVRITLCREADIYTYRLLVRDDQGRVSNFTVDARHPFGR